MLWIGERTRDLDGAHVEFLRGVGNPIGCKVGPTIEPAELLELCEPLNPARIPGRLTLISRMGADHVEERLRPLLRAVADAGHPVVWACDPMHGNTFTAPSGRKTRHFDDIVRRDRRLRAGPPRRGHVAGRHPRRAHRRERHRVPRRRRRRVDADLDDRYETMCDPRLNARQSLDLAFRVAELISGAPRLTPCVRALELVSTWPVPHVGAAVVARRRHRRRHRRRRSTTASAWPR